MPNQTLVCLCGLDEGTQKCTEESRLTPCDCPNAKGDPPGTLTPAPSPAPAPTPTPSPTGPRCGNGALEVGETCDDGNTASGDGCSATCTADGAPKSAQMCPGQPVAVWKATPVALAGSTAGYIDLHGASCYDALGPDRVYAITPQADGVLAIDASFDQGFNAVVSVRRDCAANASELLCQDTLATPFKNVVSVTKGQTIYLLIDGDTSTASGAFAVRLELL